MLKWYLKVSLASILASENQCWFRVLQRACRGNTAVSWDLQSRTLGSLLLLWTGQKRTTSAGDLNAQGLQGLGERNVWPTRTDPANPRAQSVGLRSGGTLMESPSDVTYWGRRSGFPGDWGTPARSGRKGHPRDSLQPLQPLQRVGGALKPQRQSCCPAGPATCCGRALARRDPGAQMLGAGTDPRTLPTVTLHSSIPASTGSEPSCSPPHPGVQGPRDQDHDLRLSALPVWPLASRFPTSAPPLTRLTSRPDLLIVTIPVPLAASPCQQPSSSELLLH